MITAKGIHKSYNEIAVLKDVNLQINEAEILSIMGASGAGKSTLLHILGTLDTMSPPLGSIEILGERIDNMKGKTLAAFRNKNIGFIFQFHQLLPEFTALENVCLPAFLAGESKPNAERKAKALMAFLGLQDRLSHRPSKLSGGEQQRVSVARALINQPSVVFADEPSGNLDSQAATQLHHLFVQLRDEFHQTFVIVTHSESLSKIADRIIHMKDGKILRDSI